jgi:hypothetical protein
MKLQIIYNGVVSKRSVVSKGGKLMKAQVNNADNKAYYRFSLTIPKMSG